MQADFQRALTVWSLPALAGYTRRTTDRVAPVHVVLKYLLQLRLVLIAAELLGLAIVDLVFGIRLAWPVVGGVLGALAAFSLWSWQRWRGVRDVPAA